MSDLDLLYKLTKRSKSDLQDDFVEMVRKSPSLFADITSKSPTINVDLQSVQNIEGTSSFKLTYFIHLSKTGKADYFRGIMSKRSTKDFDIEYKIRCASNEIGKRSYPRMTGISERSLEIYPRLASAGFSDYEKENLLLEEHHPQDFTLEQKRYKNPLQMVELDTTKSYHFDDFHLSLDALVLHHWLLEAYLKSKKIKIQKSAVSSDALISMFSSMDDLGMFDNVDQKSLEQDIEKPLERMVKNYLEDDRYFKFINNNTSPANVTDNLLLDARKASFGPLTLDLARLLGCPEIYSRIGHGPAERVSYIESIMSKYLLKTSRLREDVNDFISDMSVPDFDVDDLEKNFYFTSAFLNFERAAELMKKKEQKGKKEKENERESRIYHDTAMSQLKVLADKRDSEAEQLVDRILHE